MSRIAKMIIGALVAVVAVFLLWYFRDIVVYIILAAVLAVIGRPLMALLLRIRIGSHSMPRWGASIITLVVMWVIMLTFFTTFFPMIINKFNELASFDPARVASSVMQPVEALQRYLQEIIGPGAVSNISLSEALAQQINGFFSLGMINQAVTSVISLLTDVVIALFSITFIGYFFLKEEGLFTQMIIMLFPPKYENNIRRAVDSTTEMLVRYLTGILTESLILTIFISLVLTIFGLGLENAVFIGATVGVFNVIPYVGPVIGFCVGVFIGIVSPIDGFTVFQTILTIGCTILCAQGIDNFILQPMLYSNRVKAHPLEIFIVILIAGSMAGVVGMLLAIPSYTVLRVIGKEFFSQYRLVQKLTEKM